MKRKKYPGHSQVHPALFVRNSQINMRGVFTSKEIKRGETVFIFGGILIKESGLDEKKFRMLTLFPVDDKTYIGLPISDKSESLDEFLNHSCDPNTWLTDEVTVVARRNIKAGEEITLDCATWDSDPAWKYSEDGRCYCGSKICRKTLSAKDWKKKELLEKYKGHFAPYIEEKIRKMKPDRHLSRAFPKQRETRG